MIGNISAGLYGTGAPPAPLSSYESIATVSVGSGGQSSVAFTSIPSTYKHLQVRAISRSSRNDSSAFATWVMNVNSDTGSNYTYHRLYGNGTSAGADGSGVYPSTYFYQMPTVTTSNIFGVAVWDILDYASTSKNKTIRFLGGSDLNGNGYVSLGSGLWINNTTAISSISLTIDGGSNFTQYSSFALYGIRG
jgi:hypothetical protein